MTVHKQAHTVRMDNSLSGKVKYLATKERRSTSNQILFMIERYISEYEAKHGPIPVQEE